jgi:hypothetical protein
MSTTKNLNLNALRRVTHAVGTDESRPNLCAIAVVKDEKTKLARLVTTDGHRLATEVINGDVGLKVIAYGKAERKARKPKNEAETLRYLQEARDSDETFPDWERVCPVGDPVIRGTVDRKTLLDACTLVRGENEQKNEEHASDHALDLANARLEEARSEIEYLTAVREKQSTPRIDAARANLARDKADVKVKREREVKVECYMRVRVDFHALSLRIETAFKRVETIVPLSDASVNANASSAAGNLIGVNVDYLIESLESFKCERVTVELRSQFDPVVVRSETGFDLIMPARM